MTCLWVTLFIDRWWNSYLQNIIIFPIGPAIQPLSQSQRASHSNFYAPKGRWPTMMEHYDFSTVISVVQGRSYQRHGPYLPSIFIVDLMLHSTKRGGSPALRPWWKMRNSVLLLYVFKYFEETHNVFEFPITSQYWDCSGIWNLSPWRDESVYISFSQRHG